MRVYLERERFCIKTLDGGYYIGELIGGCGLIKEGSLSERDAYKTWELIREKDFFERVVYQRALTIFVQCVVVKSLLPILFVALFSVKSTSWSWSQCSNRRRACCWGQHHCSWHAWALGTGQCLWQLRTLCQEKISGGSLFRPLNMPFFLKLSIFGLTKGNLFRDVGMKAWVTLMYSPVLATGCYLSGNVLFQTVSTSESLRVVLSGILRVLLHSLNCNQSERVLQNIFATQRSIVYKVT